MWRVPASLGFVVWALTIAASAAVNYIAGHQFGRSPEEAQVFAVIGSAADAWKALGPIFILTLWRGRKFIAAAFAGLVWLACFTFAVSAALGLVAQNRSALMTTRENVHISYLGLERSLNELAEKRAAIGTVSSPEEYRTRIATALARPLTGGTIGSLSDNCSKDVPRTRLTCADIAHLHEDLARAIEAEHLDAAIAAGDRDLANLRERGGARDSDPQATLISAVTFGRIPVGDVGLVLMLILVTMVELISAFAPVVLREFIALHRATPRCTATGRGATGSVVPSVEGARLRSFGNLKEYLVARIIPDVHGVISEHALFADYQDWSLEEQSLPIEFSAFIRELDDIAARELGGCVTRRRKNFHGLRIKLGAEAP